MSKSQAKRAKARAEKEALSGKRKAQVGSSDDEGEADNDDDDDDYDDAYIELEEEKGAKPELHVDFGFCDPMEIDYHDIRALITPGNGNDLLPAGAAIDLSGVASVLCEQAAVGSVAKVLASGSEEPEEGAGVLGFMSAISLHQHRAAPFAKALTTSYIQRCADSSAKAALQTLLAAESSGLVISARMINLPPALVPDLVESLLKDIAWAGANSDDPIERETFQKMTKFIVVASVELSDDGGAGSISGGGGSGSSAGGGGKKKQKRAMEVAALLESLTFARPEEEVLAAAAEWSTLLNGSGRNRQLLMALTPSAIKEAIPGMRVMMGSD